MEKYVIYHYKDHDGLACGYIAYRKLNVLPEPPYFIPYNYGEDTAKIDAIPNFSDVYMMDISLPIKKMVNLARRTNLIWIDHHKNTFFDFYPELRNLCAIVYDEKISACRLAWRHFFPYSAEPAWCQLVGLYDVFDKSGKEWGWHNEILPYEYALRQFGSFDVYSFEEAITQSHVDNMIASGISIARYAQSRINMLANLATYIDWQGMKCMIINSGETGDMWYYAPRIIKERPDILVFANYSFVHQDWKVSLRNGFDTNIDCASIASQFGGGGHKNAAGFRCKNLPF